MQTEIFEHWAILELFGHARIAGKVMEQQIGGASFIRVDVPELEIRGQQLDLTKPIPVEKRPPMTRFYGPSAIYSITPVAEDVARLVAAELRVQPVSVYVPSLHHALGPGEIEIEPENAEEGGRL